MNILSAASVGSTLAAAAAASSAQTAVRPCEEGDCKDAEKQTEQGVQASVLTQQSSGEKGPDGLTEEERKQVEQLKKTDQEVRQHEQAHSSVGGPYAGSPTFTFTTGPDGKQYAVSGEVAIDASPVRDDPEATIRKMDVVIRAALAPADPSSQDQQVAAQARSTRLQAQAELQKERLEEARGNDNGDTENANPDTNNLLRNIINAYKDALGNRHSERQSGNASQLVSISV